MTLTVIILTYKPDERFDRILRMLALQRQQPERVLVVNTGEEWFRPQALQHYPGAEVVHIRPEEFDHGGTRAMAAELCDTDVMLFMTQDAVPKDEYLIEELMADFAEEDVACVYARQLPAPGADPLERYSRSFNYGQIRRKKTADDLPRLGIKTFFCSDVCAAYRRSIYERLCGFEKHVIFNEDMILAGRAVRSGYAVVYEPEAQVIHSHSYSGLQQLRRNFDLGVSQAQYPGIFESVSSEKEGLKMVTSQIRYLSKNGKMIYLPKLFWQTGCKLIGYKLGKAYRKLPDRMIEKLTMNPGYWKQ
ncbi:MAG: glycosyltransferase [Lachnospiraceae bacterium]|nr:glycosyltransferase [Lachnospiraceae bacterium]